MCSPIGELPAWFFEESQPHLLLRNNSITGASVCPSVVGSLRSANYNTPIQTASSYPIIGRIELLNPVAVADKLQHQTMEEKGNLCPPPSCPPASRSQRDHLAVGAVADCESPTSPGAAQSAPGAPAD